MTVKPFIVKTRAGIGTTSVESTTSLKVSKGNVNVATMGSGIIFPDGTFQTTAAGLGGYVSQIFTYTGDGSTTSFSTSPIQASSVSDTSVYVSGIYQRKSTYLWTDTNIVFDAAPAQYSTIEINVVLDTSVPITSYSTLTLTSNTSSTSTGTGAIVTNGGAGIAGNAYIGGNLVISTSGKALIFPDGTKQTTAATGGGGGTPGGTDRAIQFNNSGSFGGDTTKLTLDTNGNVGIGVASPVATLHVAGTIVNTGNVGIGTSTQIGIAAGNVLTVFGNAQFTGAIYSGTYAGTWNGSTIGVSYGGTGLTSGTSGGVLYYSASGTLASSAALAANALVVGGGAGAAPSTITTGTGVVTALGVNTGTAGAFVVNGGALGIPSSGNLISCTSLPVSTGISGLGTGVATALGVNTGTAGAFVVNGGVLGTPSSGNLSNCTSLSLTTGVSGTLAVGNGGTGATTFTSNGLLYGNGTSAVQVTAQGGANTILTANAGAPSFSTNPTVTTITTTTGFQGGYFHGSDINASAAALANSLTSNTTVTAGTGLTVTTGGASITGATQITGNLSVTGNLILGGNAIINNANVLVVDNPIIYVGDNNPANLWDLGIVGSYTTGSYQHTGILRNHTDGVWTVFDNLTAEPTKTIDWASATLGKFKAGNVNVAASTSSTSTTTGALIVGGGVGITGNLNVGGTANTLGTITSGTWNGSTIGVAYGGTGITSGTSGGVLYYSAAGTLASSAALAANSLVIGGGAGATPSTITTGTGVVTALGVNTGSAGAFVVNGGALGTPSSGTLTNCTGLPVAGGGTGAATFTANGVIYGNGTSALQVTAQGAANTILTANAGAPSFSAAPTIGTSVTCPIHYGGTAASSSLTLQSTSGAGTSDSIVFKVGNAGAAQAMTINTNGNVGVFTSSPVANLHVTGTHLNTGNVGIGTATQVGITAGNVLAVFGNSQFTGNITGVNNLSAASITTTGSVGIGTASPTSTLHVEGNTRIHNGHVAIGNVAVIDGTTTTSMGAGTATGSLPASIVIQDDRWGNLGVNSSTVGYRDWTTYTHTGLNSATVQGVDLEPILGANGTGPILQHIGINAWPPNYSASTITQAIGGLFGYNHNGSGTVTNAYGSYVTMPSIASTGSITTNCGLFVSTATDTGAGGNTNLYGIYVADQTGTSSGDNYNIASLGSNSQNYFGGKVGIGVAPPSAPLHVSGSSILPTIYGGTAVSSTLSLVSTSAVGTTDSIVFKVGNNGGTQAMTINTSGNVGIGTASPINTLHVQGNVTITGDTTVQGTVYETSDIALKENVETISGAMGLVTQLRGVNFNWKANHNKSSGVIAQEIEQILPYLVRDDESGLKSVNYTAIIGILIEAIKELSEKIEKQ